MLCLIESAKAQVDFRKETIYFLLPTRFSDGDPANNRPNDVTWRGIPSVYYGTEARFKSGAYTDLHDAAGISRSLDETGRAFFGNAINSAPNHIIYKHIRKLNAIRKAIPALQNGNWNWAGNPLVEIQRNTDWKNGLYLYQIRNSGNGSLKKSGKLIFE